MYALRYKKLHFIFKSNISYLALHFGSYKENRVAVHRFGGAEMKVLVASSLFKEKSSELEKCLCCDDYYQYNQIIGKYYTNYTYAEYTENILKEHHIK